MTKDLKDVLHREEGSHGLDRRGRRREVERAKNGIAGGEDVEEGQLQSFGESSGAFRQAV
jgi:hypothetical protein